MATIRQRINRKNAAGTYDTIHLETSSDLVLRPDGTTLESTIVKILGDLSNKSGVTYSTDNPKVAGTASPGIATTVSRSDHVHPIGPATHLDTPRTFKVNLASTSAESFDGSANVTPGVSGILPVANGGTGMTSLEDLGDALVESGIVAGGINGGAVTTTIDLGTVVNWAGHTWVVVHVSDGTTYLALNKIYEMTTFGTTSDGVTAVPYAESNLAARAAVFENSLPSMAVKRAETITVNGVTSKIFVCTSTQAEGGFSWFSNRNNRICKDSDGVAQIWRTSTVVSGNVQEVRAEGGVAGSNHRPYQALGFRPFVAIRL